jgi:hypothetical protein
VTIYSDDPDGTLAVIIDEFSIHTSCSVPLAIDDEFGNNPSIAKLTLLGEPIIEP